MTDIFLTGNIVKVDPLTVSAGNDALGAQHSAVNAAGELAQNVLDLFNGELTGGLYAPGGKDLVGVMMVMAVIVMVTAAALFIVIMVVMMLMLVTAAALFIVVMVVMMLMVMMMFVVMMVVVMVMIVVMMVFVEMMVMHRMVPPFSFLLYYIGKGAVCQNNYL